CSPRPPSTPSRRSAEPPHVASMGSRHLRTCPHDSGNPAHLPVEREDRAQTQPFGEGLSTAAPIPETFDPGALIALAEARITAPRYRLPRPRLAATKAGSE